MPLLTIPLPPAAPWPARPPSLQYLPQVWALLFNRLQSSRTTKYVRCFLLFLAAFVAKRGGGAVSDSIEAVQPGLTLMIMQQVGAGRGGGEGGGRGAGGCGALRQQCRNAAAASAVKSAPSGGPGAAGQACSRPLSCLSSTYFPCLLPCLCARLS